MSRSDLVDIVSLICYTQQEKLVLLGREGSCEIWMPSKKVINLSWSATVQKLSYDLLGISLKLDNPLHIHKVWVPEHSPSCIYHIVYSYDVPATTKVKMKLKGGRLQWYEEAELFRLNRHKLLRNPEILRWIKYLLDGTEENLGQLMDISGLVVGDTIIELCEIQIQRIIEKNQAVWTAAQWTTSDIFHLYREFVIKAFPALLFSFDIFTVFMLETLGWLPIECRSLFRNYEFPVKGGRPTLTGSNDTTVKRSADDTERGGISFRELAIFVAATEPDTLHNGIMAELRIRYIFRYYDANGDGQMENAEFKDMIAAIRLAKQMPVDVLSVSHEADECLRKMGLQPGGAVSQASFNRGVAEKRLRGLSVLMRSPRSLVSQRDRHERVSSVVSLACVQKLAQKYQTQTLSKLVEGCQIAGGGRRGSTKRDSRTRYEEFALAACSVRLQSDAQPQIEDLESFNDDTVSPSTLLLRNIAEPLESRAPPAQTLAAIHAFVSDRTPQGNCKDAFTWNDAGERATFGALLLQLTRLAKPLFNVEPRLLRLRTPIYVIGDLHGNLAALLKFESTLWPNGAGLSPARLLFLGDYVDRGPHGVEVVAYLLAIKLQRPAAVHLVRGNHEIRNIQQAFTFYNECLNKFGEIVGKDIWGAINEVFDMMPLAAVIDDKVFCCHGGIPPPWLCPLISAIDNIPVPLPNPVEQSSLAWELMWNDPIRKSNITPRLAVELAANDGFAANFRRGTGHLFAQLAMDNFLYANSLSHVVRAHELQPNGFMLQLRGELLSVFSSIHYCGGSNHGCIVFIDGGLLRLIRIDE